MTIPTANTITWTQYYDIITGATPILSPGDYVPFSMDGAFVGNPGSFRPRRVTSSIFAVDAQAAGTYGYTGVFRITWQVPVKTPGQLGLIYGFGPTGSPTPPLNSYYWSGQLPTSIVGSSWGKSQICGDVIVYLQKANTTFYFAIPNLGVNLQNIELLSSGAGAENLTTTIIFQYLV